jgi:hypothetical protein
MQKLQVKNPEIIKDEIHKYEFSINTRKIVHVNKTVHLPFENFSQTFF